MLDRYLRESGNLFSKDQRTQAEGELLGFYCGTGLWDMLFNRALGSMGEIGFVDVIQQESSSDTSVRKSMKRIVRLA